MQSLRNIRWFSSLGPPSIYKEFICTRFYDKENYPVLDNVTAINIKKCPLIPIDYSETMAVPITYLDKHDPDQFNIIGVEYWPYLSGKQIYKRILIKRKC